MFKNTRLNMNVSYNIEVATSMEIGSNFKIVEWADLVTLDLSTFDAPGGKEKLAAQLKDAVHNVGFFYITGFGLSQQEVDRQFAIGKEFFALPTEEKVKYKADLEHGNYNGYRPKGSGEILPGKRDNVEMYNVFKFSKFRPFSTSLQR
jgi:isopenicillin N synthase-like dioxygenase